MLQRGAGEGRHLGGRRRRDRHHQPARDDGPVGARNRQARCTARSSGRTGAPQSLRRAARGGASSRSFAQKPAWFSTPIFPAPSSSGCSTTSRRAGAGGARRARVRHRRHLADLETHAAARVHVTDASTPAARCCSTSTRGEWDDELCALLDIPRAVLPRCVDQRASARECEHRRCGRSRSRASPATSRRRCSARRACRPGWPRTPTARAASCSSTPGRAVVASKNKLISTVAWQRRRRHRYALEGSVFIGGAVVQWLRDGLKSSARAVGHRSTGGQRARQRRRVPRARVRRPRRAPLGPRCARGCLRTDARPSAAHIARAALESIAFQSAEVLSAMEDDAGLRLAELRVDGGAAANNLLMQFQADLLGVPVVRPKVLETTALGAAYLAGLAVGFGRTRATSARIGRSIGDSSPRCRAIRQPHAWRSGARRSSGRSVGREPRGIRQATRHGCHSAESRRGTACLCRLRKKRCRRAHPARQSA